MHWIFYVLLVATAVFILLIVFDPLEDDHDVVFVGFPESILDTTPELDVLQWHSINQLARTNKQKDDKMEEKIAMLQDAVAILAMNQVQELEKRINAEPFNIDEEREKLATLRAMLDTLIGPSEK